MIIRPRFSLVAADELAEAFERARQQPGAQTNFRLPIAPWWLGAEGITCVAAVNNSNQFVAVEALARGANIIVSLPDEPWAWPIVRDFDRLGQLDVGAVPRPAASTGLSEDQLSLLRMLASGRSIPQAATDLFMSVRTAERRVGAARRLLGVSTTAEAILLIGANS